MQLSKKAWNLNLQQKQVPSFSKSIKSLQRLLKLQYLKRSKPNMKNFANSNRRCIYKQSSKKSIWKITMKWVNLLQKNSLWMMIAKAGPKVVQHRLIIFLIATLTKVTSMNLLNLLDIQVMFQMKDLGLHQLQSEICSNNTLIRSPMNILSSNIMTIHAKRLRFATP